MKTKITNFLYYIICCSLTLTGCTATFDDLNTNPDTPNTVTSAMLATTLVLSHLKSGQSGNNEYFCKRIFWGEQINNYQYNVLGKGSFGDIQSLTDAQKMVELSPDDMKDAYTGLFYYLKAWAFYSCTMDMGDIPYSEALQVNDIKTPKYDTQKDVFKGILSDLAQADSYFAKATKSFEGDPFYKGDPSLWRKATNVFRLKVLMSLQKRVDDASDLKVKETFAQVVSEGNLFKSNADNLQITYSNKSGQTNPYQKDDTKSIEVYAGTHTIIDTLKLYKDYRLFYYFAPMQARTDKLYLPSGMTLLQGNDWDAYEGVDAAGVFNTEQRKISVRMFCRPNDIYRNDYAGVPVIKLGYADMNFVLAEAAERGWITGSAKDYYEEGIRASFNYVKSTVSSSYAYGMEITDDYINNYLKGEHVAYASTTTERLKQIWEQEYLAQYFHMAWDSWYLYRRTRYPIWPVNPETNLNDEKTEIPLRWLYPESESNYNSEQLKTALDNQWGGVDNINKAMWIIK